MTHGNARAVRPNHQRSQSLKGDLTGKNTSRNISLNAVTPESKFVGETGSPDVSPVIDVAYSRSFVMVLYHGCSWRRAEYACKKSSARRVRFWGSSAGKSTRSPARQLPTVRVLFKLTAHPRKGLRQAWSLVQPGRSWKRREMRLLTASGSAAPDVWRGVNRVSADSAVNRDHSREWDIRWDREHRDWLTVCISVHLTRPVLCSLGTGREESTNDGSRLRSSRRSCAGPSFPHGRADLTIKIRKILHPDRTSRPLSHTSRRPPSPRLPLSCA
jgi:hypothetical protein